MKAAVIIAVLALASMSVVAEAKRSGEGNVIGAHSGPSDIVVAGFLGHHGSSPRPTGPPLVRSVSCTGSRNTLTAAGVDQLCGAIECSNVEPTPYGLRTAQITQARRSQNAPWRLTRAGCVAPAPPAVTIADVRQRVVRMIPTAALGLAPAGTTLVNIKTITWVNTRAHRTLPAVTILRRQVQITLALDHVGYDFGDGSAGTTDTAGTRYDTRTDPCKTDPVCPGYDGHTYRHTGSATITATAYWRATYRLDGANPITIPGTVAGPATRATLTIREARGILVPNP